ncbi:MAG: ABC transporter permease [Lachnospiraceae bacterium]|nr:ABC transporter permease [Lachnospiraceae bacterium]
MSHFLNPLFERSMKQNARMKRTLMLIVTFEALLAGFGLFFYYVAFDYHMNASINYRMVFYIFDILTLAELVMVFLVVPVFTAGAISMERERQTLDVLISTGVSPFKLIVEKLLSTVALVAIMGFASLPILAIVYSVGGVGVDQIIGVVVLMIAAAILFGSIGIFFSTICNTTMVAIVSTYVTMILIFLITLIVGNINTIAESFRNRYGLMGTLFSIMTYAPKGAGAYLLLLNPIYIVVKFFGGDTAEEMFREIRNAGGMLSSIEEHWVLISGSLLMLISFILLVISAKKIRK